MKGSESKSHVIAWGISIVIHVLVLALSFPQHEESITLTPEQYHIPVQLSLQKPKPAPKKRDPKPVPKKVQKKRPPVKPKRPKPKLDSKRTQPVAKPVEPTRLPGDRDVPVIEEGSQRRPVYPKLALNNGWEGTVKASITVDGNGRPTKIDILESSGYDSLDRSFVRTIQTFYKFKPKRKMGKNIAGTLVVSFTYSLNDT